MGLSHVLEIILLQVLLPECAGARMHDTGSTTRRTVKRLYVSVSPSLSLSLPPSLPVSSWPSLPALVPPLNSLTVCHLSFSCPSVHTYFVSIAIIYFSPLHPHPTHPHLLPAASTRWPHPSHPHPHSPFPLLELHTCQPHPPYPTPAQHYRRAAVRSGR